MPAPPLRPSLGGEIRRIASLGFPVAISLGGIMLIGVVDTVMISPLGTVPLAAASLTSSVMLVFLSALYGFVSVIGVRQAEAHGRRSAADLSDATRTGLAVAAVAGLLGAAAMLALRPGLDLIGQPPTVTGILAGYWSAMAAMLVPFTMFYVLKALFDAIDRPWVGVALAFLAVLVNIPANYLLIHGIGGWPGLGLIGAGLASFLSEALSLLLGWLIWRRARFTAAARDPAPRTARELRVQMREGAAVALGYVSEGGAYAVAALMMGWFGVAALAAQQIVGSVSGVLYMVPLGVSIAVSIRVGQAIGADERDRLTRIGLAALIVIVSWMGAVMAAILLAGPTLARSLSDDPEVVVLAMGLFVVIAAMQIADGVQGTMLGACRGMTDNRVPVAITLVGYWVVALPVGYVLGFVLGWGPQGVWIGYGLGLALAATLVTRRFFAQAAR